MKYIIGFLLAIVIDPFLSLISIPSDTFSKISLYFSVFALILSTFSVSDSIQIILVSGNLF
jgi:hypothetical protein